MSKKYIFQKLILDSCYYYVYQGWKIRFSFNKNHLRKKKTFKNKQNVQGVSVDLLLKALLNTMVSGPTFNGNRVKLLLYIQKHCTYFYEKNVFGSFYWIS